MNSVSDYFSTPDLKGLLRQIRHLCIFGADALVVEGALGSGKSSLANQLADALRNETPGDTHIQIVLSHLFEDDGIGLILSDLCNQFGLWVGSAGNRDNDSSSPPSSHKPGECLNQLRKLSQNLIREKRLGLILIDDAHFMSDQLLAALLSLLQCEGDHAYGFRFILFGETGVAKRIDEVADVDTTVYDFAIPEFSCAELERFVLTRHPDYVNVANKYEWPTIKSLWSDYGGNPGIVLKIIARQYEGTKKTVRIQDFKRIPMLHVGLAAGLVALLILVLLYDPDDTHVDAPTIASEVIAPESEFSAGPPSPKGMPTLPLAVDASASEQEADTREAANDVDAKVKEIESTDVDSLKTAAVAEIPNSAGLPTSGSVAKGESGELSSNQNRDQVTDVVDAELENIRLNVADTQKTETKKTEPTKPEVSDQVPKANADTKALAKMSADEVVLMQRAASSYVLQLLATSAREKIENFVRSQPNKQALRIYRKNKSTGGNWYIVVEGAYPDRRSAQRAIATLPAKQRESGPWPKKIEAIKKEILSLR